MKGSNRMVPLFDLRASLLTILLGEDNVRSRGGRDEGETVSRDDRGLAGLLRGHDVGRRKESEGSGRARRVYIVIF